MMLWVYVNNGAPTEVREIDTTIMSVTKLLMDKLFKNSRILTHFVMRSTEVFFGGKYICEEERCGLQASSTHQGYDRNG
jgi:hypothetical protein